jgi:hypothetical protein
LLIAVFISYRGKRDYDISRIARTENAGAPYSARTMLVAVGAIAAAFVVQLETDSMILGGLIGFLIFSLSGVLMWSEGDDAFTEGMKMLAMVGFIMITASGFAQVLRDTGLGFDARPHGGAQHRRSAQPHVGHGCPHLPALQPAVDGFRLDCRDHALASPSARATAIGGLGAVFGAVCFT